VKEVTASITSIQKTVRDSCEQLALVVKKKQTLPASAGDVRDTGSSPGLGRCPGGGHGNPLQYSCLENPMDRPVLRVTQSQAWLKQLRTAHMNSCMPIKWTT